MAIKQYEGYKHCVNVNYLNYYNKVAMSDRVRSLSLIMYKLIGELIMGLDSFERVIFSG